MRSHVKCLRECESTITSNNGKIANIVMKPRTLGTFVKNILSLMTAITNSYLQGKEETKFLDDDNKEKIHSLKLCQTWIDEILKLKVEDGSRYGPKGMILDEVSATCYHKIGIYHLHTGDTDESKENLIKEKEILVELRSQIDKTIGSWKDDWSRVTERLLYCESALGETFDNNGDDTDALKCYCRARAIFDEPDYKHTCSDMKPLWRRHELLKKKGKKKSRKRKAEDDVKIKQENIKSEPEDEDSTDDEEDYEMSFEGDGGKLFPSSSSSFSSSSSSNSSPPPPSFSSSTSRKKAKTVKKKAAAAKKTHQNLIIPNKRFFQPSSSQGSSSDGEGGGGTEFKVGDEVLARFSLATIPNLIKKRQWQKEKI